MNRTRLSILSAAIAAPLILSSFADAAQKNFVTNGDFSQGLTAWNDWNPNNTELTVTAAGTLNIQAKQPSAVYTFRSVSQCIPLANDQQPYQLEGDVTVPLGQARKGDAYIRIGAWPTANCIAPTTTGPYVEATLYPSVDVQHVSKQFNVAPGTKSLRLTLAVRSPEITAGEDPGAVFRSEFDNFAILGDDAIPEPPQDPPADPTPDPGNPPSDPVDPPQDPGDPPAEPEKPVVPDVPKPWTVPAVPQGPFDVVIPGPLGGTPDPGTPSKPSADEPATGPQTGQPGSSVTPTATPRAIPATTPTEPPAQAAVADATPLPPSAGAGLTARTGTNPPLVAGLALTALSITAAALSAAGARMKRR